MDPARFDTELLTPAYLADPYQYYCALREREPVYWSDRLNAWVLTRYDDVQAALRHPQLISGRRVQSYADGLPPDAQASLQPLFIRSESGLATWTHQPTLGFVAWLPAHLLHAWWRGCARGSRHW